MRGATSAEYFLEQGYAVIFMHRQFSQQPFLRHYSHSTNPFLNFLDIEDDDPEYEHVDFPTPSRSNTPELTQYELPTPDDVPRPRQTPRVVVNPTPAGLPLLLRVIRRHKEVHRLGTLHTLTFVTVDDYLFLLRELAKSMRVLGRQAMYYLAAAVSDFFLPRYKMVSHYSPNFTPLFFVTSCRSLVGAQNSKRQG
jgi:phosphopantothenate---cysteine ligase (ATP)